MWVLGGLNLTIKINSVEIKHYKLLDKDHGKFFSLSGCLFFVNVSSFLNKQNQSLPVVLQMFMPGFIIKVFLMFLLCS